MPAAAISPTAGGDAPKRVPDFERWISAILRGGVAFSIALLALGALLTFAHHPDYWHETAPLHGLTTPGGGAPHASQDLKAALAAGRGQGFSMLGLLVLIATPIVRVAVAAVAFWFERDRAYVAITLTVLSLLLTSLFLGRAGG